MTRRGASHFIANTLAAVGILLAILNPLRPLWPLIVLCALAAFFVLLPRWMGWPRDKAAG